MLKWRQRGPDDARRTTGAGDPYWRDAAAALQRSQADAARVLAPVGFSSYFAGVQEYHLGARISGETRRETSWLVLHKAQVDQLDLAGLLPALITWQCIFANEVFCIFAAPTTALGESRHLNPLIARLISRLSPGSAAPPPAARQAVYLGNNTALTRTVYGHKMFVDSRDISLTPHLLLDGDWESWIAKVVRRHVRPGTVAVDVGANCGFYSLLLAEGIGPSGRLFAFEGNPRMADLTRKNLEVNGFLDRSTVAAVLVGDAPGRSDFLLFEDHMGSSSLQDRSAAAAAYGDRVQMIEQEMTSLDVALADVPAIHFLKVDAEGAEDLIFKGAQAVMKWTPLVGPLGPVS